MAQAQIVTFRVPQAHAAALHARAASEGRTVSEVLREFTREYITAPESEFQDALVQFEEFPMTG